LRALAACFLSSAKLNFSIEGDRLANTIAYSAAVQAERISSSGKDISKPTHQVKQRSEYQLMNLNF
jgi:hypothetical protein